MPYKMRKLRGKDLYKVVNTENGRVASKGTTKEKAKRQIKRLYEVDNLKKTKTKYI